MPTPEELEDAAARDAVAGLKRRLEELTLRSVTLWESLEPETRLTFRAMIARTVAELDTSDVADPIRRAVLEALDMGMADAARRARVAVPERPTPSSTVMLTAIKAPERATEELERAAEMIRQAETPDDLQDAFIRARRAVSRTEAAARFAVNRALSEGTQHVADLHRLSRVWIPERDACVHCLAYAGEVAGPGEAFRGGLTFGAKPLTAAGDHVDCPLHPNCRCRVQVYAVGVDSPDFPAALKREALRSVLRGWSLASESPRVRLQAAERALKHASRMPKSVQDYARSAIKRGAFPRGRAFPTVSTANNTVRKANDAREVNPKPQVEVEPKRAPGGIDSLPRKGDGKGKVSGPTGDLNVTNPKYGEPGYGINCVHVVNAYELRRRGYDVEATPLPTSMWGQQGRNATEALHRWREPERPDGTREFTTLGLAALRKPGVAKEVARFLGWPPGARGWMRLAWVGGGGHIFSVEVAPDGRAVFTDAQTHTALTDTALRKWFARATAAQIVRVDDLVPTDAVMEFVRAATAAQAADQG